MNGRGESLRDHPFERGEEMHALDGQVAGSAAAHLKLLFPGYVGAQQGVPLG